MVQTIRMNPGSDLILRTWDDPQDHPSVQIHSRTFEQAAPSY